MSELKTQVNDASVLDFINAVESEQKRQDCLAISEIFTKVTGETPKMWGTSIIGFGSFHYKSERSTQEGDWPLTGFSPRKQNITIYIMPGFKKYTDLMQGLGKYKTTVSCLSINKLSDIDTGILEKLIAESVKDMKEKYGA